MEDALLTASLVCPIVKNTHITPSLKPNEESMMEADDFDVKNFDKYISAQVSIPKGDTGRGTSIVIL
jgi:hypothetical protein